MDIKMNVEKITAYDHPSWDVTVSGGIVPIVMGDEKNMQSAIIAAFLQQSSVPQLPAAGVPWTQFLTKQISFGDIDSHIRQSVFDSGNTDYYPDYSIEKDRLTMSVGREQGE